MKKISLIFVVIAVLALVLVGACGGDNGEEETTATTTAATSAATTTAQTTQPSNGGGGGLTWNDMPVYGGADQIQRGSWSIPVDEGDYSEVEWRFYETGADVDDVINFYKDKMPDNGWDELMWMDMQETAWAYYSKNNEQDIAAIWVMPDNGDTIFGLMRATE